jgi:hypothetical protein
MFERDIGRFLISKNFKRRNDIRMPDLLNRGNLIVHVRTKNSFDRDKVK